MVFKLRSWNYIIIHLLLLLMCNRPFLLIEASRASSNSSYSLLLVLALGLIGTAITSEKRRWDSVNRLLWDLRVVWWLFLFFHGVSHCIVRRNWRQRLLGYTYILSLSRSRAGRNILLVVLLVLRRALSILLDSTDLALVDHAVLIIIVASSRGINMWILIRSLWRIDCSRVLLLWWWRGTYSPRSANVGAVWNICTIHIHYLVEVIILLVLAHCVQLLRHLIGPNWSLMMRYLIGWRGCRNLRYLRINHSSTI